MVPMMENQQRKKERITLMHQHKLRFHIANFPTKYFNAIQLNNKYEYNIS